MSGGRVAVVTGGNKGKITFKFPNLHSAEMI